MPNLHRAAYFVRLASGVCFSEFRLPFIRSCIYSNDDGFIIVLDDHKVHRSRIRILRIFSFLKFNEFYEFFPLKKIRKKFVILQIIDV